MSERSAPVFSRRRLLRAGWTVTALALVGPALAACQQAPSQAPAAATPQVVEKTVEKVVTQVVERVVTATPAAAPQAAAKAVELKLSTDWNAGPRKEVMDAGKTEYEKNFPNVKVEHWHLGAGGTSGPGGMTDIVVAQLLT